MERARNYIEAQVHFVDEYLNTCKEFESRLVGTMDNYTYLSNKFY